MKHLKPTSRCNPAMAQFEPVLNLIGVFSAILNLPSILLGQAQAIGNILLTFTQLDMIKSS
ncbi:MAG: hypothetical protein K1Y02_14975 [Candidatus Hydrogenedentes bacterium]|nr:hypothetical protein [Candidatus Hydrogenedentota bacterium]